MSNYILYLISIIIEICACGAYAKTLFQPRHSKFTRFIFLFALCIVLYITSLFVQAWSNICLFALLLTLYLLSQYTITLPVCFLHVFILTALDGITEMIVFGITNYFTLNNTPSFIVNTRAKLFITCIGKPLYFLIIQLIARFLCRKQSNYAHFSKADFLLLPIPVLSLGILFTFPYNDELSSMPELNILITLCACLLLLLNLLVFGINQYNQKRQQQYTQMQLLCQKESDMAEYYRALVQQDENQRVLIHDIRRHLASIDTLAAAKETDKIHAYIQQLQTSSCLKESLQRCDIPLLNAILCRYANQCETRQISFHTDIRSHTVDFLTDADLTALFCNLLDNALRAASIPDGFIELHTYTKTNSPFSIITVVNSCLTDPFSGPGRTLVSSKNDHRRHGFGLKSVQRVIDRYDGAIKMYFDLPTLTFHTILTLRPEKC